MKSPTPTEVTQLLVAWSDGDQAALDKLVPLVHAELHRLAKAYMRRERPGHTLQTTALVNEVYLRLVDCKSVHWQNRAHFLAVAARLMRRVLVDFARSRNYSKRGGKLRRVSLEEVILTAQRPDADFAIIDEALTALEEIDPRKEKIAELKFFGGLSVEEIAEVLKVSPRTVMREWNLARAWLRRELRRREPDTA